MKQDIAQFYAKHNVRTYTIVLLGLYAVTNNILVFANYLDF